MKPSLTLKQRYALRAALRFAWSHPTAGVCALRSECRNRGVVANPRMAAAVRVANDPAFAWGDPAATSRPLDRNGATIWNERKVDAVRMRAWIAAAEAAAEAPDTCAIPTTP